MKEIKSLTSLRGIFAMWVLGFHLCAWSPLPGWMQTPIVSRGYLAVDFFFVLSGFILARTHAGEFHHGAYTKAYRNFVFKRVVRLFPLHWLVLIANLAGLLIFHDPLPWRGFIVGEFALAHRWNLFPASAAAMNPADWSISTEWAASILFPFFVLMGLRRTTLAFLMGGICVALNVFVASRHRWIMDGVSANSWLPMLRCGSEFGIGVLLSRLYLPSKFSPDWAVIPLLVVLILSIVHAIDLLAILSFILIIGILSADRGWFCRLLSISSLHWLGRISYSAYLIQIPTLLLVRKIAKSLPAWEGPVYAAGTIAVVLVVAAATNQWVERPLGRWGKSVAATN